MKAGRLLTLVLVVAVGLGLTTASSAVALPEFTPTGASVAATGGTDVVRAGEESITCEKNEIVGGPTVRKFLIGPFRIHFLTCTSSGATKVGCPINTSGQASGLILTKTLHIVPVLVIFPSKRHVTRVRISPVAGKEWLTLMGNECTKETEVTGELLGNLLPVGVSKTTGKLELSEVEEKGAITEEATYEGGEGNGEYTGLGLFSKSATISTNETITFSSATELT
jgi:hypothetical protein